MAVDKAGGMQWVIPSRLTRRSFSISGESSSLKRRAPVDDRRVVDEKVGVSYVSQEPRSPPFDLTAIRLIHDRKVVKERPIGGRGSRVLLRSWRILKLWRLRWRNTRPLARPSPLLQPVRTIFLGPEDMVGKLKCGLVLLEQWRTDAAKVFRRKKSAFRDLQGPDFGGLARARALRRWGSPVDPATGRQVLWLWKTGTPSRCVHASFAGS
jgi:hypothetical protein